MNFELPSLNYFDLEVSLWSHTFKRNNPIQCTLGDFLTGKIFAERNMVIHVRDYKYLFAPYGGSPPKLNNDYYQSVCRLMDGYSVYKAVENIQRHVAANGKDEIFRICKKLMPGATISASFGNFRQKKAPHNPTRILAVDIDNVNVEETIEKLSNLKYQGKFMFFWIGRSISCTGVFALIACKTDSVELHFNSIRDFLFTEGIVLDQLKDITRLRYWSDTSKSKLNTDVIEWEDACELPREIKRSQFMAKNISIPLGVTTKFDNEVFARRCHEKGLLNVNINLKLPKGDIGDHLHIFLKFYTWAFNCYGLSLDFAVQWTWDNFFKDHEYIVSRGHTIERLGRDFENFYNSYKHQHHLLDYDSEMQACLGSVEYDSELELRYGDKLSWFPNLPLIGPGVHKNFDTKEEKWIGWEKYILDSPTNSGKTSTFTKYFLRKNVRGLIVVPTQGSLEQLKHEFPEVSVFYEKSKNVKTSDVLICTTYASFSKIPKSVLKDRFLVVDEFHNAVLSASKAFRNYELNNLLDQLYSFDKVVLMTGTNLKCHHPAIQSFKKVKVRYIGDTAKNLQIIYYKKNKMRALASKLKKYDRLQVIYMDDKNELKGLGKVIDLLKANGYKEGEIQLVNADQKLSMKYKKLITTGNVSEGVKIIIATRIFVEALNLYDRVAAFHILTPLHGAYMQQLVTRPRKNKTCDVYLYWSSESLEKQDDSFWFDQEYFFRKEVEKAEMYVKMFDNSAWDDIHRESLESTDVIRKRTVPYSFTNFGLMPSVGRTNVIHDVDYLSCDYNTQERQLMYYQRNPVQLYKYLELYNWAIKEPEIFVGETDQTDKVTIEFRKAKHEKDVSDFLGALVRLGTRINMETLALKQYDKEQWKNEIRHMYYHLNSMVHSGDANELIMQVRDNKRAYENVVCQLEIIFALRESDQDDTRNIATRIFEEFPSGSRHTSSDIHRKMLQINGEGFGKAFSPKMLSTKTKTTQTLNNYVETRRCKIQDSNGVPRKGKNVAYKNGIEIVSHHPVRRANGEAIVPRSKGTRKVPSKHELWPHYGKGLVHRSYAKVAPESVGKTYGIELLNLENNPELEDFYTPNLVPEKKKQP